MQKISDGIEQENAYRAFIQALTSSIESRQRVCNPGKVQRLCVAVLQGRLSGVHIDRESDLSAEGACALFFHIPSHQNTEIAKEELLQKADAFAKDLPLEIRPKFLCLIED